MKIVLIVSCLVLMTANLYPAQAQLLPQAVCSYCVNLFRTRGCLDRVSVFCRILALKFTLRPLQTDVCTEFPCEGYGQNTGNQCTGLLSCPINRIRTRGICPLNRLCCAP